MNVTPQFDLHTVEQLGLIGKKKTLLMQKDNYVINCIPASGWNMAWTFTLALEAIMFFRTQSDITSFSGVSRLTQAHPIGMVALAVVLTMTHL